MDQTDSQAPRLEAARDAAYLVVRGDWVTAQHAEMAAAIEAFATRKAQRLDVSQVERFDTFGVMQLEKLKRAAGAEFSGVPESYQRLFEEVQRGLDVKVPQPSASLPLVQRIPHSVGEWVTQAGSDVAAFLDLWGQFVLAIGGMLTGKVAFRPLSFISQLERVAYSAVPIMLLITFLIGAIIGQQGIFHFRKFGAETYVVDMVGILTLREIGVLIVAVMVAGRTGSAYTAELGSMKMREEIDALQVMGLSPVAVLVVPRILALVVGLPLLTILGDLAAITGGALVAQLYGGIPLSIFLQRFQEAISLSHLWVGLAKAPFMALIIGMVACVEGLRVRGSAESLGEHTTASVVKAIFVVIVLDGVFAIAFAAMNV